MNLRTVLLLVTALFAAGATAYFAKSWLSAQRAAFEAQVPDQNDNQGMTSTEIMVAKEDISTGTFLKPEHLAWQPWPDTGLKEDYILKDEASERDFEGSVARNRLFAGEPITRARVVHPGDRGFLAAVLDSDKRAVSVPIDATTGISGFVFPGDSVDVLLTFRTTVANESEEGKSDTRYFSETLLTGVRVLAIDQTVENQEGTAKVAKTATLEVTPKQAEKIAIALEIGELSLSLQSLVREGDDQDATSTTVSTAPEDETKKESYTRDIDIYYMVGDPLGMPDPSAISRTITILRGDKAGDVKF
jgi:pilus assembly protein CpaB